MNESQYSAKIYEPAITLSPAYFESPSSPNAQIQTQFLHCVYNISANMRYVFVVWADSTGHLLECTTYVIQTVEQLPEEQDLQQISKQQSSCPTLRHVFQHMHNRSVMYMKSVMSRRVTGAPVQWDYAVYKCGETVIMEKQELTGRQLM